MAKSGMRVIRRPNLRPGQNLRDIRAELIKELKPVASQHTQQRNAVVKDWQVEHKPEFRSVIAVTPKQVRVEVFIKNATTSISELYGGTIEDLWGWINKGTKAHVILPRFKKVLRFRIGEEVIFTKRVNHPGTTAQKHNEKINKRLRPFLIAAIRRGYNKGFQRAFR